MPAIYKVLFVISLLPVLLALLGGYLRYRQFGRFDNNNPRLQQAHMTGLGARAMAAQKNAWEALVLYASMCLLAEVSGVDVYTLSYTAVLFLLCRIAHPVFYLLDMATYRSSVFAIGWACCVYIGWQSVMMI